MLTMKDGAGFLVIRYSLEVKGSTGEALRILTEINEQADQSMKFSSHINSHDRY